MYIYYVVNVSYKKNISNSRGIRVGGGKGGAGSRDSSIKDRELRVASKHYNLWSLNHKPHELEFIV